MKNYQIQRYETSQKNLWDAFIKASKNATFLFYRDFMEYHHDRFEDFSLLIFDAKQRLVALFPANKVAETLFSHQGLTFGGLLFDKDLGGEIVEDIFIDLLDYLNQNNLKKLILKQIPTIYHKNPSNEIDYFLFKNKAKLMRRDMNLAIDFSKEIAISKSKLKHFRRVYELEMTIEESQSFEPFWNEILTPRLALKHDVKPVHTLSEITKLKTSFPENIKQYNAYFEGEIVAGITLFCSDTVIKSQYGATSEKGEKLRALDFLFINLIQKYKSQYHFFDMGIVNENNGKTYNKGLLKQKEELGCQIFSQDYYEMDIANFTNLSTIKND